ncbi:MAG: signal peptidase I, partial [Oscillospiraceae bacterium]|nr:signal peptidase I [Oscillospiraceae bacterium]
RVIGTAGDWIDVTEDGTVYVNNEPIDEPYLMEKAYGICDISLPYQVPDNCIFVMGDNRAVSVDSRSSSVGSISDEFVIGKVILRLFPFNRLGLV